MTCYSTKPRGRIFVKRYGFLSFAKNTGENIGKKLKCKYSPGMLAVHRTLFDHGKYSATDAFETASKRVMQKTAEATSDLIGNKIAYMVAKLYSVVNSTAAMIKSEVIEKILHKEKKYQKKYIGIPEKRQQIIDELRLM